MANLFGDLFTVSSNVDLFDISESNLFLVEEISTPEVNLFLGLINSQFKNIHKQMIDALLEDTALTQRVRFVYTGSRFEDCPNCVFDPIGGKSSNMFQPGGPQYFHNGQMCPLCNGQGKKVISTTEFIYLMVVWDSKSWVRMASNAVQVPEMMIQTKCKMSLKPKIMKVSYIEITDMEGFGTLRFTRHGDPEPCGFNGNNFLHTMWKRTK